MADVTPSNLNFQSAGNYQFIMNRGKVLTFNLQQVKLPNFTLTTTEIPVPGGVDIKVPGNKVEYSPLTIMYKLDESFESFIEIHDWLRGCGAPEVSDEYKRLLEEGEISQNGLFAELNVIALNNKYKPTFKFIYWNCFPIFLGINPDLDTTLVTYPYMTVVATFNYTLYNIEQL